MARTYGTEAVRLDTIERQRELEFERSAAFDVVEGSGLDAEARRGVTVDFLLAVRLLVVCVMAFAAIGAGRVALTTATASCLLSNLQLRSEIMEAQDTNAALRIERSVLCSASRVERIATQNLGMVPVSCCDHVSVCNEEPQPNLVQPTITTSSLPADTMQQASAEAALPNQG